jgi:hypothetical protein
VGTLARTAAAPRRATRRGATATGFQVLEVWESRSDFERYNEEVVLPVMRRMAAGRRDPAPQQDIQEFDVHGLVLAGGRVVA